MLPPAELDAAFEAITKHGLETFRAGLNEFNEVRLACPQQPSLSQPVTGG
jgi:hypothetical protein